MRNFVTCFLPAVFFFTLAYGQASSAILGVVTDESGGVIPGVSITVTSMDTGRSREAVTNDMGDYRVPSLVPGSYEVRAQLPGFSTLVRRGLQLTIGSELNVALTLSIGEVSEEVMVTGDAALVDTTQSVVGGVIETQQIQSLPLNGRGYTDLAILQEGVVLASSAAAGTGIGLGIKISISGQRYTYTSFTLDGTDINDTFNQVGSVSGIAAGVEAVREFKVVTHPFSAEYGRSAGGEIQVVTKSGTNQLTGSIYEFHRNSAMDARNFFDVFEKQPPFIRHQFGAAIGGPIVRDRTFLFFNFEGLRESLSTTQNTDTLHPNVHLGQAPDGDGGFIDVGVDPAIAPFLAVFPLPNGELNPNTGEGDFHWVNQRVTSEEYYLTRIDHQLTSDHNLYGRYVFNDGTRDRPGNYGLIVSVDNTRTQYTMFGLDSVISTNLFSALQLVYNRSTMALDAEPLNDQVGNLFSFSLEHPSNVRDVDPGPTPSIGPSGSLPRTFAHNVWQIRENVSWQRGSHGVKFGTNLQRMYPNMVYEFNRAPGSWDFLEIEDFLTNNPDDLNTTFPAELGVDTSRSIRQWLVGLYLQDDWRVRPSVTLNLGLRYEFISVPKEKWGRLAQLRAWRDPTANARDNMSVGDPFFDNPSLKNLAPRVGVAWDVTGDGKMSLRAGFGAFYDQILPYVYRNPFARTPPFYLRSVFANDDPDIDGQLNFPDFFETGTAFFQARLDESLGIAMEGLQPDLDQPTVLQYNLTLQREVGQGMSINIGYSGARGYNIIGVHDFNQRVPEVQADGRLFFPQGAPIWNPSFERIRQRFSDVSSFYNALNMGFRRRAAGGLGFQFSYTLSKAIDDSSSALGSGDFTNDSSAPIRNAPLDASGEKLLTWSDNRGLAAFDVRHKLAINFSYDLPLQFSSGVADMILGGWSINSVIQMVSGNPFNVSGARTSNGRTNNSVTRWGERNSGGPPNLVAGAVANTTRDRSDGVSEYISQYYDPLNFELPEAGYFGNLGRLPMIGPGRQTVDFSLFKNVDLSALGEEGQIQFRAEFFNLLNRANFGLPDGGLFTSRLGRNSDAGEIEDTIGTARQIQFALKILF